MRDRRTVFLTGAIVGAVSVCMCIVINQYFVAAEYVIKTCL